MDLNKHLLKAGLLPLVKCLEKKLENQNRQICAYQRKLEYFNKIDLLEMMKEDESVLKQMGQKIEEENLKQMQEINLALQEQINNLKCEFDERGIMLQTESEELSKTKDLLDNAKYELMAIQSELMQSDSNSSEYMSKAGVMPLVTSLEMEVNCKNRQICAYERKMSEYLKKFALLEASQKKMALQEQLDNMKYELDERCIILKCKSEDLTEAKNELMAIQSELMQLRNKPQLNL